MARKKTGKPAQPIIEDRDGYRITRTGIYTQVRELKEPEAVPLTPETVAEEAKEWNTSPERLMAGARMRAVEILKDYAVPTSGWGMMFDLGNGRKSYTVPDDAPRPAHIAVKLYQYANVAETCSDPRYKMLYAFLAGCYAERIQVVKVEGRALAQLKSSKLGAEKNRKNARDKHAAYAREVEQEITEQINRGVRPNFTKACEVVAERNNCSLKSVAANVPNRWTARQ